MPADKKQAAKFKRGSQVRFYADPRKDIYTVTRRYWDAKYRS